ncbi:MAG: hypothetical protein A2V78_06285 [Betaproteobacteria bacterium RBG_16_64_18]|nr:MAG: hypothetical protein A2V78_06285 [Betaproteobacteria bacterium RBG_16_64_18]
MLLGTALLILGALVGYWVYDERGRVEALERDRLQVQARVIDENLGRQLEGVNNALAGVRNDYSLSNRKSIGPATSRHLKTLADAMPGVRTMSILDAEGTVLASSRDELIGMNFSAREYFKVPRERLDPATLYVSPPFKTVLGVFLINGTRVATGSRGEFAGIVSAALDPEYFNVLLQSVLYAPDMWVSIAHGDGMGFLYMPLNERAAGIDLAKPGSFFSRHRDSGQAATVMTGTGYATGEELMMAIRTIRPANVPMDKPLVVGVGRDIAAIYAPWRKDALMDGGLYGAIALTAILGLTFSQRRQRKYDRLEADYETDRRESAERQERALRASEEKYRSIYDNLQDLYVETDLGGTILEISPQIETLSGGQYRREDLLGRSSKDFYGDPERRTAFLRTLMLTGTIRDFESTFVNRDGTAVPCSISATIRPDAEGRPGKIVSMVRDVTARKRAELSLRESEERLRAIFEGARDGILVTDVRSGKFLTGNPAICRVLGYTLQEIVRVGVSDIHPKQDLAHVIEEFKRLQRGESQVVADFPVIRKDGSTFHADIQLAPIRLGMTDCALSIVRDITERRHAVEALRASEAQFRLLAEENLAGVVIIQDGRFKYVNPARARMLGYSPEEMLGASSALEFVADEDRPLVQEHLRRRQHGEAPSMRYTFRGRRKDGSLAYFEVFGSRIDFDGRIAVMSTVLDVTERKLSEQELQRSAAELRTAYRRLAQVQDAERRAITKELHDQVGQNLSALNLNLHYIDRELSDAERARLKGRLDDSLVLLEETVARVRSVMGNLHPPMLDEFGLFATLRWLAHEVTHRSGIESELVGTDPGQRLPAEIESTLMRIAQEALMNAVKYSKARRITLALAVTERQVRLEIADDGVGFDLDRQVLCDVNPTWGLMTMRERAAAVGGLVHVASSPGAGSRVVAEIPRGPA